jgi:hypothetical protein
MNKFRKDLVKKLGEAADHAEGRANSAAVHVVEVPELNAAERRLGLRSPNHRCSTPTSWVSTLPAGFRYGAPNGESAPCIGP